jgi:hypothetical protein
MINLASPFVVGHKSMSSKEDRQCQSLQIETCNPTLMIKKTIKEKGNFELTQRISARHVKMILANSHITNNPGFRLKHPGVPDGSDGSDRTSYPLTENYKLPVAKATDLVA